MATTENMKLTESERALKLKGMVANCPLKTIQPKSR